MNQSLINSNIFFFITSISVVILTLMIIIFLFYIIRIARDLRETSKKIREESEKIIDDVSMFRETVEYQGGKIVSIFRAILGSFFEGGRTKSKSENRRQRKVKKGLANKEE